MKILLFGGDGQLGLEIQKRAEDLNFEIVSPVISEVDIRDRGQLDMLAERVKPDLVLNCAAYTDVDKAEAERELAFAVNSQGACNLALLASQLNVRFLHVSTDFVFDGSGSTPLREDDPVNPVSVYGASKLAGEQEVLQAYGERSLIVRTSSLHGARGNNFVHTMLRLFSQREVVKVVSDRYMSPTWAGWLAEVLLDLSRIECNGIVHASCAGAASWFDFAAEILEVVRHKHPNAERVRLEPVGKGEFSMAARRPDYSVFDCSRLTALLGRSPIPWQDGLRAHLGEMGY